MTGPGVEETAASFMGLGVSQSHGKWSIKFCLRHFGASSAVRELPLHKTPVWVRLLHLHPSVFFWGVISWKGAATLLSPRVHLSSSLSTSVFVCLCFCPPTSSSFSIFSSLCQQCHVVLFQGVSTVCPVIYIQGSRGHIGVCVCQQCVWYCMQ